MFSFRELNKMADLKDLYEKLTGAELRKHSNHWTGACPKCGGDDRFYIDPTKTPQLWTCTHCDADKPKGQKMHTALDLVALCEGLPNSGSRLKQTADRLAQLLGVTEGTAQYKTGAQVSRPVTVPMVTTMPDIPNDGADDWQYAVTCAVNFAHDILMSDAGKHEREYLMSRGFTEDTLRKYRIGFNPNQYPLNAFDEKGNCIKALTGIYIPTYVTINGKLTLLRVKVRVEDWKYKAQVKAYVEKLRAYKAGQITDKPQKPQKYFSITGSKGRALFCAEYSRVYPDRIIYTEGEFDAMTINQVAPDLCHAVSFGSYKAIGAAEQWQAWYRIPEHTVICFDNDPDPDTYDDVRKKEKELRAEIIKAQSLDVPEDRATAPVICNLREQYHDWNDILKDYGAQTVRDILSDFFGDHPHDHIRDMG